MHRHSSDAGRARQLVSTHHVRPSFPLFQSHLDLAHSYWKQIVQPGDSLIDATCGNGHDALFLCKLALQSNQQSKIFLIDKQLDALQITQQRLQQQLDPNFLHQIHFLHQCHSHFPNTILPSSIKLIVYNLGYLPGGNKQLTTMTHTTVQSLTAALPLIAPGGAISVTCYPRHPEGKIEEHAVLEFASTLNPLEWNCCTHHWINRKDAPSLLLLQRAFQGALPPGPPPKGQRPSGLPRLSFAKPK